MELLQEKKVFVDSDGLSHDYFIYYVVIFGVKVYLTPKDSTGKSLLSSFFETKGKVE